MSTGEMLYLILVIAAFAAFALVLAGTSWYESSGRIKVAVKARSESWKQQSPTELSAGDALRDVAA